MEEKVLGLSFPVYYNYELIFHLNYWFGPIVFTRPWHSENYWNTEFFFEKVWKEIIPLSHVNFIDFIKKIRLKQNYRIYLTPKSNYVRLLNQNIIGFINVVVGGEKNKFLIGQVIGITQPHPSLDRFVSQ